MGPQRRRCGPGTGMMPIPISYAGWAERRRSLPLSRRAPHWVAIIRSIAPAVMALILGIAGALAVARCQPWVLEQLGTPLSLDASG